MNKDIAELQTVQEKLEQKIKSEFVELMPDDVWRGLVKKSIDNYIDNDLDRMVRNMLEQELKETIKNYISVNTQWNDMAEQVTRRCVAKMFEDGSHELMISIFHPIISNALQHLKQNIY